MAEPAGKPGFLVRADRLGRLLENALLALLLAGMLLIGGAQIFLRNFLDSGLSWADEALRLMLLWLAMVGAVAASRDDRHIAIDALARILPPQVAGPVAVLVNWFTAAVCLTIAWHAVSFVAETREYGDELLGGLPAWWFQAILPVSFLLIGYRYLGLSLRRSIALLRREPLP